jgi:hypothetical protein
VTYGFGSLSFNWTEGLRDFMLFDLLEWLQGSCSLKYLMNSLPRPYFSPSCDSNIAVPHSKKLGCQVKAGTTRGCARTFSSFAKRGVGSGIKGAMLAAKALAKGHQL